MDGGGDVEDVERAMAALGGCLTGKGAGVAQHGIHVEADEAVDPGGDVLFPIRDHAICFTPGVAFGFVFRVEPDLQFDCLEKFEFQQIGETQRFADALPQPIRRDGMTLNPVDRTKETGVGVVDHGSPVSNARISSTSS
jgi:hypothetical protein